jgi:hemerythrin superfamily protein
MSEGGPTFVMRHEHRQIGQLLESIHDKVARQELDSDQVEQLLLNVLGSHNMKEERVLYPSIDTVTNEAERETVFRNMKTIPEDRYNACCSEQ